MRGLRTSTTVKRNRNRVSKEARASRTIEVVADRIGETRLAWELVEALAPLLKRSSRAALYVQLGAGDTTSVIKDVLAEFVALHAIPPPELIARVHAWLDCYIHSAEEPVIRQLLRRITLNCNANHQTSVVSPKPCNPSV
jgi:hypothetical protein